MGVGGFEEALLTTESDVRLGVEAGDLGLGQRQERPPVTQVTTQVGWVGREDRRGSGRDRRGNTHEEGSGRR